MQMPEDGTQPEHLNPQELYKLISSPSTTANPPPLEPKALPLYT